MDRVRFIRELAREVLDTKGINGDVSHSTGLVEKLIGWMSPTSGWFKLNTDRASHGNPGLATAGGVLRNEDGVWCGGFALNIGWCSAPRVELRGVYYELYIAWEQGVTRLELEVDLKMVLDFFTTRIGDSHPLSFLANYVFTLPLGFHLISSAPPCVVDSIMREDASDSFRTRQVPM